MYLEEIFFFAHGYYSWNIPLINLFAIGRSPIANRFGHLTINTVEFP